MKKELNFPIVYIKDRPEGYGGNQEWFLKDWQRKAGCGSTSGVNLAAYYALNYSNESGMYKGDILRFKLPEYLHLMEEMFSYMKPGLFGYPYVKKFGKQFVKYCRNNNFNMKANILDKFTTTHEAYSYVKRSIDSGNPVALLILLHRAKELREDNWHWVTITGYEEQEGKSNVMISNCGKKEMIEKDVLFEVDFRNRIRMVSFYQELN